MNPSIPPFGVPLYWRDETSGRLARAVMNFFAPYGRGEPPEPLSEEDLYAIRYYLTQYIEAPCWRHNPYADSTEFVAIDELIERARSINNREDINRFIELCLELGLDPF